MSYPFAPMTASVRRAWLVLGVLLLLAVGGYQYRHWRTPTTVIPPLPAPSEQAHLQWFQIVRIPDVPSEKAAARAMKERLENWLQALNDEGFHIRPLSEIVARLKQGEGVPAKTLALVFDPGYRFTYETLTPLLRSARVPVLWLTDAPGRYFPDRRFITARERSKAAKNLLWDVGLRDEDPLSFALESSVVPLADGKGCWAQDSGRYGINRVGTLTSLNRLHANANWNAQELIERLYAELPIEKPVHLCVQQIGGHHWGSMVRGGSASTFNFQTDTGRRAAWVCWLGTLGQQDFRLSLRVEHLFGQLWFSLRSDRMNGRCLRVGFSAEEVIVEQERDGKKTRLASHPCTFNPDGSLQASIDLLGPQLFVRCGTNEPAVALKDIPVDGGPSSMLEMLAYDRVRGAGSVEGLELLYEPAEGKECVAVVE